MTNWILTKGQIQSIRKRVAKGSPITRSEWEHLKRHESKKKKQGRKSNPLPEPVFSDGVGEGPSSPDSPAPSEPRVEEKREELPFVDLNQHPLDLGFAQPSPAPGQPATSQAGTVPPAQPTPPTASASSTSPPVASPAIAETASGLYRMAMTEMNKAIEKRGGVVVPEFLINAGALSCGVLVAASVPKDTDPMMLHALNAGVPVGMAGWQFWQTDPKRKEAEALAQREEDVKHLVIVDTQSHVAPRPAPPSSRELERDAEGLGFTSAPRA